MCVCIIYNYYNMCKLIVCVVCECVYKGHPLISEAKHFIVMYIRVTITPHSTIPFKLMAKGILPPLSPRRKL